MLSTHLRHRNCNVESAFAVKFEVKFIPNPAIPCAARLLSLLLSKVRSEGRPPRSPVLQEIITKSPKGLCINGFPLVHKLFFCPKPNKNPTAQEKPLQARQIILFPILSILYISGQFGQSPILHTIMHDTERYITI